MGAQQALADLGLEKVAVPLLGLLGGAARFLAKPLTGLAARAGGMFTRGVSAAGASPGTMSFLGNVSRGAARDAGMFGLLGGGIGAATAEPGQRGEGFLRGAASGMLGGAAWRMGSNLARRGLISGIGGQNWGKLHQVAKPGWFSSPQAFGAKMVTRGLPFAGALGASMAMPTFDKEPDAPQTWGGAAQQQVANYGQPQYAGYMPGNGGY